MIDNVQYKLVYLDTNVVSDLCKQGGLILKFISKFPPEGGYLLCFSTYTLFEISRSNELFLRFKEVYSVYPCALVFSYFPLLIKEIELLEGKTTSINPILFSPQSIQVDGTKIHPDTLDRLMDFPSVKEALGNVHKYTSEYYLEVVSILDDPAFANFDKQRISSQKGAFVRAFKGYELKKRLFNGQNVVVDEKKLRELRSLDVLAHGVYYKFYSDGNRRTTLADIVDVLIMTTVPYVHTFVSEKNSVEVVRKIQNQSNSVASTKLVTLSDLRL